MKCLILCRFVSSKTLNRTLVLGGIKSGKSRFAESLATDTKKSVVYIATASPDDEEMRLRIEHHKISRPSQWQLVEEPIELGLMIKQHSTAESCVLVDCLTLWLTNLLMHENKRLLQQKKAEMISAITEAPGIIVLVSNETSMGIVPMGELTRQFCDEAGLLHQKLADLCDNVVLTVAGLPHYLKESK